MKRGVDGQPHKTPHADNGLRLPCMQLSFAQNFPGQQIKVLLQYLPSKIEVDD